MKIVRVPAVTFLVFDLLKRDILTEQQLRTRLPQCSNNQISAALIHLKKHKAIGFLADEVTTLYYATPESDDRSRVLEEVAPDQKRPGRARRAAQVDRNK